MIEEALKRIEVARREKLTYLDLSGMGLKEVPSEILDITWLKTLSLADNELSDISGLSALQQIHKLALSHNKIVDITPLSRLKKLKFLFLEGNAIKDVSALKTTTTLKKLVLTNNTIFSIDNLDGLTALVYLDVALNPLNMSELMAYKQRMPSLLVYNI